MSSPTPGGWSLLTVRRRFSTTRDLIIPVAFAALVLSALAIPVAALSGFVGSQQSSETALTQIEVTPRQTAGEMTSGLTQPVLDEITEMRGVVNVIPDVPVGIYAADGGTWALSLRPLNPASVPPDVGADASRQVVADQVIVPAAVDDFQLTDQVGSDVAVSYTRMTGQSTGELAERRVRFIASYDPSWQGYGPGVAFASKELVVELLAAKSGLSAADYMKTVGLAAITVTAATAQDVDAVTAQLRELGLSAIPVGDTLDQLPGVFAIFPQRDRLPPGLPVARSRLIPSSPSCRDGGDLQRDSELGRPVADPRQPVRRGPRRMRSISG